MHRKPKTVRYWFGVAAVALLAGCTNTDPGLIDYAEWKQMEPPPRLQVQDGPVTHAINFAPGETQLSDTESAAINAFLASENVGPGKNVTLEAPSAGTADTDRVAHRLATIRSLLEQQGVTVSVAPPAAPGAMPFDQIQLTASRATVSNPDCPGYNQPVSSYDRFGRPNMNLGCSNEINLGLMVADPSDLVRGRTLAPADADRSALAVERYRTRADEKSSGNGNSTLSVVPVMMGGGGGSGGGGGGGGSQ
jgi:pilus assembly protein CpaD